MRQVLVAACVLVATSRAFAAPSPLEKAALTATPAELLAAAAKAPAGNWPAVTLREEYDVSLDDKGRVTRKWHRLYVIRNQAGIDGWNDVGVTFRPFYQDKPTIRARVIAPDGTSTPLDPSTMSDSPVNEQSSAIYSDTRQINAPLPRLRIGSVVEEEIVWIDRQALLGTTGSSTIYFGDQVPTLSSHFVLSAPSSAKPTMRLRGPSKIQPRHEVRGGRDIWTIDRGVTDPDPDYETGTPADVVSYATATISTEPSWQAIGATYRTIVETKLAEGPAALPSTLPHTATLETAKAIVAWVHEQIRYTGIEFGEASHIPGTPAQTMQRGFGDCKDKATLIVSLLRQAGISAELAVLRDGFGQDIDVDSPSMLAFDHVIVRARIGKDEIWIDGTEDLYPAGRIPARDQGRHALVLDANKSSLVVTPRFSDSGVKETRTFTAQGLGDADVTEVIEVSGAFDVSQRDWLRSEHGDDLKKSLESYVTGEFNAESLDHYTVENLDDLSKPLRLTTVSKKSPKVSMGLRTLSIYLFPSAAADRVPDYLEDKPDEHVPRRNEYVWAIPHVHVVENRIDLPLGFTPPPAMAQTTRKLGTATLSEERRVEGQTLVVTYRFDSGKQRLSAAETTELRKALYALRQENGTTIKVTADVFLKSDKHDPIGALADIDAVIKREPKVAVHHLRRAALLNWLGAGAAAKREAKAAVALEPRSADAVYFLAYYSRHDDLGREWASGYDRKAALDAYKKAFALDAKATNAANGIAEVLERSLAGEMSEAPADLAAATKAWRDAAATTKSWSSQRGLIRILIRQRNGKEAEAVARQAEASQERDGLLVAAVALRDVDAAISELDRYAGDDRSTVVRNSAIELRSASAYAELVNLQVKAGTLSPTTPFFGMLKKLAHVSTAPVVGKDPNLAVHEAMAALFDPTFAPTAIDSKETFDEFIRAYRSLFGKLAGAGVTATFLRDIARTSFDARPSASEKDLWRMEIDFQALKGYWYVALIDGKAKVIGAAEAPFSTARYALHLIAKGDRKSAHELMKWLFADLKAAGAKYPLPWGPGIADDDDSLDVATAIFGKGAEPSVSVPLLTKCASKAPDSQLKCDAILTLALYKDKKYAELVQQAKAFAARRPSAKEPALIMIDALADQKKFTEAEAAYADAVAKFPNDAEVYEAGAFASVTAGNLDESIARYELAVKTSSKPGPRNQVAWLLLVKQRDLDHALELIRAAVQLEPDSAGYVNTQAAIEAEQGDIYSALQDTLHAMRVRGMAKPSGSDWYVVGRMYEKLGLIEDALAAYKKVGNEDKDDPRSAKNLADTRISALTKH